MERLTLETIENIIGVHKRVLEAFENIKDTDYCPALDRCILRGMEELIESKTGITTMTAADPMLCVAIGTGKYFNI